MHFTTAITSSVLLLTSLATAEGAKPYLLKRGEITFNEAFGLGGAHKRQAGYAPTQQFCNGPGTTCESACGAGSIQCPSNDGATHCFNPTISDSCCSDGTGNSCSVGYFCTDDNSGNTWCCPNGMDLASCAALYSITGSLSTLSTLAPSSVAPASVSVSASITSLPTYSATPLTTITSKASLTYASVATVASTAPTTTAVQFLGAGNKIVHAAVPALVAAAGVVMVL